jgi:hypothetical protein
LPEVPAPYLALRSQPMTAEQIAAASVAQSQSIREKLRPAVDLSTGEGVYQVYGTLNDDGSVAMRMLMALAPAGSQLLVRLAPLAERPDLYPLEVGVEIDGQLVGSIRVTMDGPVEQTWPVPDRTDATAPIEVRLMPERWVLVPQGNSTTLASFRPLRIACQSP